MTVQPHGNLSNITLCEHKLIFCGSGNYFNNETSAKMFRCSKCDREFYEVD